MVDERLDPIRNADAPAVLVQAYADWLSENPDADPWDLREARDEMHARRDRLAVIVRQGRGTIPDTDTPEEPREQQIAAWLTDYFDADVTRLDVQVRAGDLDADVTDVLPKLLAARDQWFEALHSGAVEDDVAERMKAQLRYHALGGTPPTPGRCTRRRTRRPRDREPVSGSL